MALASLCGGIALANAKLGAVHGFAGVLGGMFDAPHGAICGRLLPFVMQANVKALMKKDVEHPVLKRYNEIAILLLRANAVSAKDGVSWVQNLVAGMDVPGLSSYGISEEQFPTVIKKTLRSSSMRGNPVKLTEDELWNILFHAL
jgi:alcohol dehydrogenase class IV